MAFAPSMSTTLRNGIVMPLVGVGTYQVRGQENISNVIEAALAVGYRSIDTATGYRNEEFISNALSTTMEKHRLLREHLFVTSKLAPKDQGYQSCMDAVNLSLKKLSTEYLDLYLIHWPGTRGLSPEDPRNSELRRESWKGLEELYNDRKLRSIGVSNYTMKHLTEMLSYAKIMPHVLQVEHHPHYIQQDIHVFCKEHGIHLQAYSSLGSTTAKSPLVFDPSVRDVAQELGRTPAQVLLRWATQQGIGILPKSLSKEHIEENFQLDFEIPESDMNKLSSLPIRQKYAWDPSLVC